MRPSYRTDMQTAPLVSVVINNYNYGRFLPDAIASALDQTYPKVEVVVVDDGSGDDSADVIRSFGDAIAPVWKPNGGQASSLNAGFKASKGDIVIFLDADDMLLPTAVERCVERMDTPALVKLHWPMWRVDARGRRTGERWPGGTLTQGDLRDLVIRDGPDVHVAPPKSPPTSGNAWSRSFLEKVLPIPEAPFRWGGDTYLLNMAPVFGTIAAIQEPLGLYRVHGANNCQKPIEIYASEYMVRFEECCRSLSAFLKEMGVEVAPDEWPRNSWYHRLLRSIGDVERIIPEGQSFVLIDGCTWGLGQSLAGRRCFAFVEREGRYWGAPRDDAHAIAELERLRRQGASFLVVAWTAFWYFEHFPRFAAFLASRAMRVLENDRLVVFDLPPEIAP
jgi:glycosyltransferase involved in cell wall biosynthesis